MDPMTNSERKIIHKALSQIEGVESHSEGDDPNRYVVVTKVQLKQRLLLTEASLI